MNKLILTLICFSNLIVFSAQASSSKIKTFPIITHDSSPMINTNNEVAGPAVSYSTKKVADAKISDAVELIKELRVSLCEGLEKGDEIKLFINWDVKTGLFGVGFGMNTGIEVNIKCKINIKPI